MWIVQDDEADDSDRLVIDEEQYSNSDLMGGSSAKNDESHENELPECQGCKKREAQVHIYHNLSIFFFGNINKLVLYACLIFLFSSCVPIVSANGIVAANVR